MVLLSFSLNILLSLDYSLEKHRSRFYSLEITISRDISWAILLERYRPRETIWKVETMYLSHLKKRRHLVSGDISLYCIPSVILFRNYSLDNTLFGILSCQYPLISREISLSRDNLSWHLLKLRFSFKVDNKMRGVSLTGDIIFHERRRSLGTYSIIRYSLDIPISLLRDYAQGRSFEKMRLEALFISFDMQVISLVRVGDRDISHERSKG